MQLVDRFVQESGEHQEREQIAWLHAAGQHHPRAEPNRDDNPERADQDHRGVIKSPDPHHDERRVTELVADRIEPAVLLALADVTLDLANAGQVVVQERVHRRGSAPLQPIPPVRRERVPKRAARQNRQRRQPHERERDADSKTSSRARSRVAAPRRRPARSRRSTSAPPTSRPPGSASSNRPWPDYRTSAAAASGYANKDRSADRRSRFCSNVLLRMIRKRIEPILQHKCQRRGQDQRRQPLRPILIQALHR